MMSRIHKCDFSCQTFRRYDVSVTTIDIAVSLGSYIILGRFDS